MWLKTYQECVKSSSRVSGIRQDGTREFARRRPRLTERLLRVAEKFAGMGSHQEFARRFTEEIGKLAGNIKGDHREKTGGLVARMPEATGLAEVGSKLSLWSLSVVIVES
ncbi:hypothetical protein BHE74_00040967 [Ensete ventricosum]|nr:hypothetical protein BHE74_00040967 [Ensete ventricosum]RZS13937.1 hypothetical protein BHM03_00045578 [Ensete ventricosum]